MQVGMIIAILTVMAILQLTTILIGNSTESNGNDNGKCCNNNSNDNDENNGNVNGGHLHNRVKGHR